MFWCFVCLVLGCVGLCFDWFGDFAVWFLDFCLIWFALLAIVLFGLLLLRHFECGFLVPFVCFDFRVGFVIRGLSLNVCLFGV